MKVFACGTSWGSNRDQFMKAFQWEENAFCETGSEYAAFLLAAEPHVRKLSLAMYVLGCLASQVIHLGSRLVKR